MEQEMLYDVVIIGAGPGGYVAAIRAAQLGLQVALIEKDKPGGVCLNIGCIPSKALIHQAEIFAAIDALADLGIKVDASGFNYEKAFLKSRAATDKLVEGVRFLLNKNKVTVIEDEAIGVLAGSVALQSGREIKGRNIILATGSTAREIAGFPFDEKKILSSSGALMLEKLPDSILILGSGAIGIEFAHILNTFGVEVHLVEIMDRILPLEDDEISAVLAKSLQKRGIKIYTSTKAVSQKEINGGLEIILENAEGNRSTVVSQQILVSAGRVPNTGGLKLSEIGIELTKSGHIVTGEYGKTNVNGIYAIGDIVATPQLAHVASKEGEIVAEYLAGQAGEKYLDLMAIPATTYCEPQVASFGLTERKALEKEISYKKSVFPYRGAGKAVAIEHADGLVKVLTDPQSGEILGAHIVGSQATELIHELLLAKKAELLPVDLATMIHAHPTLSEIAGEVMRAVDGLPIHA